MRRFTHTIFFVIFCLLPVAALAQKSTPNTGDALPAASKMIQSLGNTAIAAAIDKNLSDQQKRAKYAELLRTSFDVPTVGHFVLGRNWNTLSPDKQQEFLKLFESVIVKIYSDRINFYSGEGFHIKGERPESDRDTIVNSEITHPDGSKPTTVDWRVRSVDGKFLIVDVSIEGVSQSVTQRQEYSSILEQSGGNIDPLLDRMRQQLGASSSTVTQ